MTESSHDVDVEANFKLGLQDILHKLLPEHGREIADEADLFDIGLDSLKAVEFVLEIEDRYGVFFEFDDISYSKFKTIKSIVALMRKKIPFPAQ
jgi:acyl carrier protein